MECDHIHKTATEFQLCGECSPKPPAPDLLAAAKEFTTWYRSSYNISLWKKFQDMFYALERAVAAAEAAQSQPAHTTPQPHQVGMYIKQRPSIGNISSLLPVRYTERRDPLSADCRGEWTDFD